MRHVVKVLSTLAVMGAFGRLSERCEAVTGACIEADFAPTVALLQRLRDGEAADVVILTRQALDDLAAEGAVVPDSAVDLARSYVGIAVKAGAPRPPIATEAELAATLRAARTVAYSRIGASGIFFAALIARLGIAAEINARARIIPAGLTAQLLISGEAELAVQQISELMLVDGVDIVGPIPLELQSPMVFSAGRMARSEQPAAAAALLEFLSSAEAATALRQTGLEP